MTWVIVGLVIGSIVSAFSAFCRGYNLGVKHTEVRWRDACGRQDRAYREALLKAGVASR